MDVIWTRQAIKQLNKFADYIAQDNKSAAEKWLLAFLDKTDQLATHPESGRVVPEYNDPNLRELVDGNYRLIYRIKVDRIYIQTIRHTRQLL